MVDTGAVDPDDLNDVEEEEEDQKTGLSASLTSKKGVVLMIERPLGPVENGTLADLLELDPRFTSFRRLLEATNLTAALADEAAGPFTLLAPVNDAFFRWPVERILQRPTKAARLALLHIVHGTYFNRGVR